MIDFISNRRKHLFTCMAHCSVLVEELVAVERRVYYSNVELCVIDEIVKSGQERRTFSSYRRITIEINKTK